MHVSVRRAERHRQGVVIARGGAAITADEAHRGTAVPLAGEVEEVADDQAEMLQVPVQILDVLRRGQHDVTQALDPCGTARGTLRGIDACHLLAEIEDVRLLPGQRG